MFSGIACCAGCGEKLYCCASKSFKARQGHFACSTSRNKIKEDCSHASYRWFALKEMALWHLQHVIGVHEFEGTDAVYLE
jgi:hypothetical protein